MTPMTRLAFGGAWLYFVRADLPQLAGALTSSAKDVSPAGAVLAMLGFQDVFDRYATVIVV